MSNTFQATYMFTAGECHAPHPLRKRAPVYAATGSRNASAGGWEERSDRSPRSLSFFVDCLTLCCLNVYGLRMSGLKRNVGVLGAVAISLAVMGPSMSVSLNPQAIAEQVGPAVPMVFVIAVIPLSLITFSFVVLTKRRGSAGSLFGLVGAEIGPRTGTAAGIWLLACYIVGSAITALTFGIFTTTLIQELGVNSSLDLLAILLALLVLPLTTYLAGRSMRTLGRLLLFLEGFTMLAIVFVMGLTFYRLVTVGGPQGQTVDWGVFRFEGVTAGAIALALTFALLSSAGFEGAASAGEETEDPRRTIPRALVWTTIVTSMFFIGVTTVAVWAFGVKPNELEKFTASGSVPADIANAYVGDALGDLITLGGAISSFACMIGAQIAGGRILFAFGRDGVLPSRFGQLSAQETPVKGSTAVGIAALLFTAFAATVTGFTAFSAFELTSDTAGVIFAGAYASACLAATFVLWRKPSGRLVALLPAVGVVILLGVIALQLFPVPSGWELIAPVAAILVLIGGGIFGRARGNRAAQALR